MKKMFDGYTLVSDMDGTLINSNKEISKENLDAIKYFVNNGGKFTVATGRMVASVECFLDRLNLDLPAILHNGGKIYDYNNKKVVYEHFIEEDRKESIKKVWENRPDIGIEIFCDEVVYIYRECKYTKRYNKYSYDIVYNLPKEIWNKPWVKVLLIGDEEVLDEFEKEYRNKYDKGMSVRSGANYLDVIGNGTSKGEGLLKLIELYNLDKGKIIAVGDNMNDLEMIHIAKYGFILKNGTKRVLEKAKLIAPSNDENPIKYIIDYVEKNIK